MAWETDVPPFVFVIDTDKYAGNFEREMCAFVTGHIGECGIGQESQKLFFKKFEIEDSEQGPFFEKVLDVPDDHGCHRPVSIWPTKGRVNTGMGNCYDEDSEEAKKAKRTYSVYESVGIFFSEQPSKELIEIMKERAKEFGEMKKPPRYGIPKKIEIKGFRLIKLTLVMEEISI